MYVSIFKNYSIKLQERNKTMNTELLTKLRETTGAGMAACLSALKEANEDFDKAVDIIKVKNLQTTSSNSSKVASEGVIVISHSLDNRSATMTEINTQTSFSAVSEPFVKFSELVGKALCADINLPSFKGDLTPFNMTVDEKELNLESMRQDIMSTTKENVVVRRWFRQEVFGENRRVFSYLHSNNKLGVMVSISAPSKEAMESPEFIEFGEAVAMQVAAMGPIAVSSDQIPKADIERQRVIFQTQLKEEGKPEARWEGILAGKTKKWHSTVVLNDMESVITPNTTIKTITCDLSKKLGGEVSIISFSRCVLGEGIEKPVEKDYATEIAELTGVKLETAEEVKEETTTDTTLN